MKTLQSKITKVKDNLIKIPDVTLINTISLNRNLNTFKKSIDSMYDDVADTFANKRGFEDYIKSVVDILKSELGDEVYKSDGYKKYLEKIRDNNSQLNNKIREFINGEIPKSIDESFEKLKYVKSYLYVAQDSFSNNPNFKELSDKMFELFYREFVDEIIEATFDSIYEWQNEVREYGF